MIHLGDVRMRPESPDPVPAVLVAVGLHLEEGGEDGDPVDLAGGRFEVGVLGVAVHQVYLHREPLINNQLLSTILMDHFNDTKICSK